MKTVTIECSMSVNQAMNDPMKATDLFNQGVYEMLVEDCHLKGYDKDEYYKITDVRMLNAVHLYANYEVEVEVN